MGAVRRADPQAIAALVHATHTDVRRLAAHLVDAQSADDLVQETYLRAIRALPDFRGHSSERTWLLAIARRVCADELRARSRRRRRDQALQAAATVDRAPGPGEQVAWADALAALDPDRRAAFVTTQILGLSYAEAAEACGCPIGTIRSRVARARAQLIDTLALADDAGAGPKTAHR